MTLENPPHKTMLTMPTNKMEQFLNKWLRRDDLVSIILISYSMNLSSRMNDSKLIKLLDNLISHTKITLVTSPSSLKKKSHFHLSQLSDKGARIFLHDTLHAKMYLFSKENRVAWAVGSSNLSESGTQHNEEINVGGYHPSDFETVEEMARSIIRESNYIM